MSTKILHFENDQDIHTTSDDLEANGAGHNLEPQ